MEKRYRIRKMIAGIFFVVCVLMIASVIFVLGVEKGLTQPRFSITVLFHKVGGLAIGAPVRLSGVNIGTVANIDFLEQEVDGRGVKVVLSLFTRYREQVYKSVRIAIITEGVLGEKIVEITTAPDSYLLDLEQPMVGEDPLDVQNLAATFGDVAVSMLEASKVIGSVSEEIKDISISTRRLLNRIEQRIIEGNLFKIF